LAQSVKASSSWSTITTFAPATPARARLGCAVGVMTSTAQSADPGSGPLASFGTNPARNRMADVRVEHV
jgi:hypothetical protein